MDNRESLAVQQRQQDQRAVCFLVELPHVIARERAFDLLEDIGSSDNRLLRLECHGNPKSFDEWSLTLNMTLSAVTPIAARRRLWSPQATDLLFCSAEAQLDSGRIDYPRSAYSKLAISCQARIFSLRDSYREHHAAL